MAKETMDQTTDLQGTVKVNWNVDWFQKDGLSVILS